MTIFLVYLAGLGTPFILGVVSFVIWVVHDTNKQKHERESSRDKFSDRSMAA